MRKRIPCKKTPVVSTNYGELFFETKQHRTREILFYFSSRKKLINPLEVFENNLIKQINSFKKKHNEKFRLSQSNKTS